MASIYTRRASGFYWIKYRDPATGQRKRESTGIRIERPDGKRLARRKEAEYTHREMAAPVAREAARWEAWAESYFAARYTNPHTLRNARQALRDLLAFFREHGVRTPAQLTYEHASCFVKWRTAVQGTLPMVSTNTAILTFIYLRVLMSEAVRRGYAQGNPCREVKNQRARPKQKHEITIEHQRMIERALAKKPSWMREQWAILMRQGCRISETNIPLERIDDDSMTITLTLKGGRTHTQQLHPELLPLLKRARSENRATLIIGPPIRSWPGIWSVFFKRQNLPYSIHCTRVTVITRLLRADHSTAKVAAFIGHSEEVNRIYRRLKPQDAASLLDTLASTPNPSKGNAKRRNRGLSVKHRGHA